MTGRIDCVRLNHFNIVLREFAASVEHFRQYFDAEFLMDILQREWHAGLITFGDVIFEIFCPHEFLLNSRHGPHFIGLEYQADMAAVRAVLRANRIGIVRDIGPALHTDPADCHGIAFEFYDGSFHERSWDLLGRRMLPADYWRNAHPMGLCGLKRYSVAVRSLDRACEFLERLFDVTILYDRRRESLTAHARAYQIADSVIELVTPTGNGALQTYIEQQGEGIRSAVFAIRNVDEARKYLLARGLPLIDGDDDSAFSIAVDRNLGISFEFEADAVSRVRPGTPR